MFTLFALISPVDVELVGLFSPILLVAAFFIVIGLILVGIIAFFIWLGRFLSGSYSEDKKYRE